MRHNEGGGPDGGDAVPEGRAPASVGPGLALKTVRNVHGMLQRALRDAVAWEYLLSNPAVHAVLPRGTADDTAS